MHQATQVNIDARSPIIVASFPAESSIKTRVPKMKSSATRVTKAKVQAKGDKAALPKIADSEATTAIVGQVAAVTKESAAKTINYLASLDLFDYFSESKEKALELNITEKRLDKCVEKARKKLPRTIVVPYPAVELHPEPIDAAQLLNEISVQLRRFVILPEEEANAIVLWVATTWLVRSIKIAPLAIITAPEKGCGKSVLLKLMALLSFRAFSASDVSESTLYRETHSYGVTVLLDEVDTFIQPKSKMFSLINDGYLAGGAVARSEYIDGSLTSVRYSVFGPKALAGISLEKHLPDQTMSRGILFNIQRRLPHEVVARLSDVDEAEFDLLKSKLARFATDYAEQVRQARPVRLGTLSDRAQDNWHPLLSIASCAGEEWVNRATAAAVKLSSTERTRNIENELLADIRDAFIAKGATKLSTADLIGVLCADEEKAWATAYRGGRITPRNLSDMLDKYGIAPKTIRIGTQVPKGYELSQFTDAFARYLPPLPQNAATPQHSA
ncbi:MAG: DUF3631 domain-containing protein [Gallionellaceae bacterium]|nr:DUF3631 domain-containing protein [Gallionellaceae bacterium]